ncbi:maleate cis-trans isomerase family protein [Georgenia sp. Z1491]|uniref:maleate cis-trans isomerase family protein n=1 Tax=Georgenia sp. Z1491 TaxID=3416707 RepID=UPI003CFBBBA9
MSAHAPTVGIIYPGHAAEDDYALAAGMLGAQLPLAHVYGTDLHAADELLDLGAPERLAEGAQRLAPHRPGSVMWACTSGGFVRGPEGARRQVERLSRAAGVPASSTSLAFVAALEVLGVSRVAVAATYPDDVAAMFAGLLGDAGIEIVAARSAGITTAAEVGTLAPDRVRELVLAHERSDAGAVLVPDTALRTIALVPELESLLGRPVLTANQVTVWQGLRLAGARTTATDLGQLFTQEAGS